MTEAAPLPAWHIPGVVRVAGHPNQWTRGLPCKRCGADDWARQGLARGQGRTFWRCRPCRAVRADEWKTALFPRILAHYGGRCVECGETDPDTLVIDHINDDGAEQRRALAKRLGYLSDTTKASGQMIYRDLIARGFPNDVQILCANHNLKKERLRQRALKKARKDPLL